jgi:hypothetical protein
MIANTARVERIQRVARIGLSSVVLPRVPHRRAEDEVVEQELSLFRELP